jgi:signal transduction histidine kinase
MTTKDIIVCMQCGYEKSSCTCSEKVATTVVGSAQTMKLLLNTIVSASTAIVEHLYSPADARDFDVIREDSSQRSDNYLKEVLKLLNDSVVVLSENMEVVRFNDVVSKELIEADTLPGNSLVAFIRPEYLDVFQDAFIKASADCNTHIVEYQALSTKTTQTFVSAPQIENELKQNGIDDSAELATPSLMPLMNAHMTSSTNESKKRMLNQRNDESKAAEAEHIKAAKLHYISCIAHELKTPLSSFCLTMDILQHSAISAEQRELVQQAVVAIDMMKHVVYQTIDISKALTGAELQPRLASVDLSKLLKRVNVIM